MCERARTHTYIRVRTWRCSPPFPSPPLLTTQPTPFPPLLPLLPLPFNQPPPQFPSFFPSPIPSPLGIFPYHSFCPPHTSSPTNPPPLNLPLQPPLLPRPTTTISPTPLPNKLPLSNTTPKPSSQGKWGCKGSFCIDTKTFSLSFDDRRANSFRILKVPFGWVIRDWNGSSHVLLIFKIEFQERIICANDIEITIIFSNSREGWTRLVFLWT